MKYIGTGLGVVSILLLSSVAQADDTSDYCQKVQARAHADAWLLFSPSVQLQAIRYPAAGNITVVGGSTDAHGDQLRGNLAWSLLDTYRGTKMLTVADKDCLQHEATNEASNLLEQMSDIGRASALQAEITYIKSHNDQIENILSITQKRLAIGNITIVDMATIQQAISALERKLVQSQGQLDIIHTKDYVLSAHSSTDIAAKLQTSSMEFEKATSQFRMLDPWTVQLSGGMVPPMSGLDTGVSWYGMISVGYNFGGLVRGKYENQYLSARQNELQHARYELADQMRRLQDGIKTGISSAEIEIATLSKHIADLNAMKNTLTSNPDAPNVVSAIAMVELQIIDAESDRIFLTELKNQLMQWK